MLIVVLLLLGVAMVLWIPDIRNGVIATIVGTVSDTGEIVSNGGNEDNVPVKEDVLNDLPGGGGKSEEEEGEGDKKESNVKLYVLDTSGSSVLLTAGRRVVLFDGSFEGDADAVISKIKSLGYSKLDYLVVTNYHHSSTKGVPKILSKIDSDHVVISQSIEGFKFSRFLVDYLNSQGLVWTVPMDTMKVRLENTVVDLIPSYEKGSLIPVVYMDGLKVLITNDITDVKNAVSGFPSQVDVWVLGTKNSFYSLPEGVLKSVKPKSIVVNTNAEDRLFNKVVNQLKPTGAVIYSTYNCRDTVVSVDKDGANVRCVKKK